MKLLVDVHAHLDLKQFENDIDEVIDRAKVAGVKAIICNSTTPKSMRETIKISKKYGDIIKLALGIFPTDATKLSKEEIESEIEFIRNHKKQIVAIGEIGLDFHWEKDENNRNRQIEIFKKFLSLAKEIDKPIIVHTWDAELKVIEILEEEKMKRVVMHCFSGKMELVKRIESNKWMFSIPANIVFSQHFQNVVKNISINQILTETDAPYLSPIKGQRNEPSNVALTIKKIAEIKGITVEEVENNIFMNYQNVF